MNKSRRAALKSYALLIVIAQLLLGIAALLVANHGDSTPAAIEEHHGLDLSQGARHDTRY